jgi:hypothetical protein
MDIENIHIASTTNTPEVCFDANSRKLLLKGRSISENPFEFYKPLYSWIETYCEGLIAELVIEVRLEYFNTSSAKCLLEIFKKFERFNMGNSKVEIHWYFQNEDEEMKDSGEDFQAIIAIPFKLIEDNQLW